MSSTFQRMQESLAAAKQSAQQKINDVSSINEKVVEMWPNTVDVEKKGSRMTTDHGVKVHDIDNWLKISSADKQGPALLEDQIARERVC